MCAQLVGLNVSEYARCKQFGYPWETYGGHAPKKPLPTISAPDAVNPTNPTA